jgi:hypothetical protein
MVPVAKAPVLPKAMTKEMQKLALRYDVARIGDRKVGKGLNFYPIEKEAELGRTLAEEVEQSVVFVNDPAIAEYVNRLGQPRAQFGCDGIVPGAGGELLGRECVRAAGRIFLRERRIDPGGRQ